MSTVTSIPKHFKPSLSKYSSPFDKETLVDDDKELWLIRVPDNVGYSSKYTTERNKELKRKE
jgi:hypothetical protein